jgi:hypothetical protein
MKQKKEKINESIAQNVFFYPIYSMKVYFVLLVLCMGFVLHSCGLTDWDKRPERYDLELPGLPPAWNGLLGRPCWQIEWVNSEGYREAMSIGKNGHADIAIPLNYASAVSALPFWPDKGIGPGIFRPAGAIFPFDASGKTLVLSWKGGVDANLFWELVQAFSDKAPSRLPQNFDWPRFRLLFDDPTLNKDIRADPWLANWQDIAKKIALSGFDKRRLVPEPHTNLKVPVNGGPWIGSSPFASPMFFEAEPVFPVKPSSDTWVSVEGVLRCNTDAWILIEWGE